MNDKITVYIACYSKSDPEHLADTIDSIREQGITPIAEPDERITSEKWNEAIANCKTEYLHLAHHDDIYLPGFYKEMVGWLDAHPDAVACFCLDYITDERGYRVGTSGLPFETKDEYNFPFILNSVIKHGNFLRCPSFILRAHKANDIKYPEKECGSACDLGFFFNISRRGAIGIINKPLYVYRQGGDTQRAVVGQAKALDHIRALEYGASLDRSVLEWDNIISLGRATKFRKEKEVEFEILKRVEDAESFHLHVVHEPPDNAGTGILVAQRVREANQRDDKAVHLYVCPGQKTIPDPSVVNGVPTVVAYPSNYRSLVERFRPASVTYHHLLRWPLSILEVGDCEKTVYLHDSFLWCEQWHSFDGKEVCNEPEPGKCELCKKGEITAEAIAEKNKYLRKVLVNMRVIANSLYTKKYADINLGIDCEVENPVPPPLPYYRKRKVFAYFGGFYLVKGVHILLKAWSMTHGGTLLLFCDVPKEYTDGRVLHGYDTVLAMGSYTRSNFPHLSSLVDCVVCPSLNESFGLVSREAELLGVQSIVVSTGGQTGTIPPNDPVALAKAIQEVIDA